MWFPLAPSGLDFLGTAPFRFHNQARVPATPQQVFDVLADIDSWPRWFKDFKGATWTSPAPYGVGSTRDVKLLPLSVKERFLAWTPGERFAFTMEAITLPLVSQLMEEWRLTADGAGTVVEWTVCYRPTLLTRALHPLVRAIFDGMFKASLRGLDTYLRSRGA